MSVSCSVVWHIKYCHMLTLSSVIVSVCRKVLSFTCFAWCNVVMMHWRQVKIWLNELIKFPYNFIFVFLLIVGSLRVCGAPRDISKCVQDTLLAPLQQDKHTNVTSIYHITAISHGRHGASNHWQFNCCFNSLFRLTTINTSKLGIPGPLSGAWTSWHVVISTASLPC